MRSGNSLQPNYNREIGWRLRLPFSPAVNRSYTQRICTFMRVCNHRKKSEVPVDMEILSSAKSSNLQSLHPSLHSQVLALSPTFSVSSATRNSRFHMPPHTSSILSTTFRRLHPATRSLHEEQIYHSKTRKAKIDRSLAVKKKAAEVSPELKGTSIFLLGMKSTLKTDVGALLADGLQYYYFNSDSLVEEAFSGEFSAKSFRDRDEEGFRDSETEVLKQLSSIGRLVVSAGDGAVRNPANLALLRHGISIWLDVPIDIVAKRMLENGSKFPASELSTLGSHSEIVAQLAELYEEIKGGYATADATVSLQKVSSQLGYDDLDAVTKEDMVMEVLSEIQKLTRVKRMMEEAARPF